MGNILTVKDKKGFTTSYQYDQANRMLTVSYTVASVARTTTYHYDINGNRDQVTYSSGGVSESYTFDKNNRLLTLTNKKPDGIGIISAYSYTYSSSGLQDSKTDSYGQTKYTYDAAGRITKVEAPGKTIMYAYDAAGNRQSLKETYESNQSTGVVDGVTGSQIQYKVKTSQYVYSDANKLLRLTESMTDASGKEVLKKIISYTYDNNGNQIKQSTSYIKPVSPAPQEQYGVYIVSNSPSTDGQVDSKVETTFNQFDGFNRLKKVDAAKDGKRTITEFAYNGNDLRVSKTIKNPTNSYAAEVTNYLYDRQHVILETDGSDNLKVRYVRGINYIARVDASNKLSFFLYNGHGDVVQTVSEAGVVENQYDYDIFGEPTLATEVGYSCAIRYAGEFYDGETGLYYLRARYYSSYTGRFISEDSYRGKDTNPLSLNLYTYCYNEPIRHYDPSGHVVTQWDYNNLNPTQVAGLGAATADWEKANKAGDKAGMEAAHARAVEIRRGKLSDSQYVDASGYVQTKDPYVLMQQSINMGSAKGQGANSTAAKQAATPYTDSKGSSSTSGQPYNQTSLGADSSNDGGSAASIVSNDNAPSKGFVVPLPPNVKPELPAMPWEKPVPTVPTTPEVGPSSIGFARVVGIAGTILQTLLLRGDSDQRPWDQYEENKQVSEEVLQKIKSDPNIKLDKDDKGRVIIYRKGNVNLNTLTPREQDAPKPGQSYTDYMKENNTSTIGMSWSLNKPTGNYIQTTIEAVNETGSLIAIYDGGKGGDHVSIIPATDGPWNNYEGLTQWASTKKYLNITQVDTYDPSKVSFRTKDLQKVCTGSMGQPVPDLPQK